MATALVRRPGPLLAEGIVTHVDRRPVDLELARRQWERYCAALTEHGWSIVEVPPADDCADAVFIEDALVVFDDIGVITRPGAAPRRAETTGAETAACAVGLELARIVAPATLDGGDVLKVGRTAYVGVGGRTNQAAVEQLGALLAPHDWQVEAVPVATVLHLKSAVTALPDETVIGYADHVDAPGRFPKFMTVPEPDGAHVVLLGGDRLLMSSSAPKTAARLGDLGYQPVIVDIGEFEKLEGCVTCLSVRLRDR